MRCRWMMADVAAMEEIDSKNMVLNESTSSVGGTTENNDRRLVLLSNLDIRIVPDVFVTVPFDKAHSNNDGAAT